MLRLAARIGADMMPRPVKAARVAISRMPTCNRILPGGWEIPPDDPSLARLLADMPGAKAGTTYCGSPIKSTAGPRIDPKDDAALV
jgi:hypothetical protein